MTDTQFLRAQRRLKAGQIASDRCAAKTGRLFIRAPKLAVGSLPDRWSFHDEDLSRYAAPSNFERLQAYRVKLHNMEQAS